MACERCGGTGFEIETTTGKDNKPIEVARVCGCRRRDGARSDEQLSRELRIPPRYEHCTLEEFDVDDGPQHVEALRKVLRYCNEYPVLGLAHPNGVGLGLLFTGSNGTGKTHLAVSALRELARKHGVRGQFWDYHELLREIRNSYDPHTSMSEYDVLEPIIEMEALLLDDLGAWKITDWMNDTLFYILNRRYMARRPTLITTNYPDEEPPARQVQEAEATQRREYLVDRIGRRLRSRLLEACTVVRLPGVDRRKVALQGMNQRLLS